MKIRVGAAAVSLLGMSLYIAVFLKYVPRTTPALAFMVPLAAAAFGITYHSLSSGAVLVLFLVPLVNAFPNFFPLPEFEPLLFIFYAFVLGALVRHAFRSPAFKRDLSIHFPLTLLAAMVLISALVTVWRYGNFFPLLDTGGHDLAVNVLNVRAGEAIRRVVFDGFNYIGGILWFVLLVPLLRDRRTANRCLAGLAIALSLSLGFGFFQLWGNSALGNRGFFVRFHRINALFSDPNALGISLAAVFSLLLAMAFVSRKRRLVLFGIPLLAVVFLLPSIGSRSGFLGVMGSAAIFVFLGFIRKGKGGRIRRLGLLAAAGVLLAAVVGFTVLNRGSSLWQRFEQGLSSGASGQTQAGILHNRLQFWESAWGMWRDYPLHGVGIGAFTPELPNYYVKDDIIPVLPFSYYRKAGPDEKVAVDSAGNYYLQVASELGTPGLLLLGWILLLIVGRVRRMPLPGPSGPKNEWLGIGAAAGVLAMLAMFMFGTHTLNFEVQLVFWLNVAFLFAGGRETRAGYRPGKARLAGGALLLYGLVLGWSSFHSLSTGARSRDFGIDQEYGFYAPEKSEGRVFRWTGATAGFTIPVRGPALTVPVLASHPGIQKSPLRVQVDLANHLSRNPQRLTDFQIDHSRWQNLTLDLPPGTQKMALLIFRIERTWRPSAEIGSGDERDLGIAVGEIGFLNAWDLTAPVTEAPREEWRGEHEGDLFFEGRSWCDLDLPEEDLVVRIQARGEPAGGLWPYMVVRLDDSVIAGTWVESLSWQDHFFEISGTGGTVRLSVEYVNDGSSGPPHQDRNLFLGELAVFKKRF